MRLVADWAEGRLDEQAAADVASRLRSGDGHLVDAYHWYSSFRDLGARLPVETPPPVVRQRLRGLLDRALGKTPQVETLLVVHDSRLDADLVGARSGPGQSSTSRLTLRSPSAEVVLVLRSHGDTVDLRGQVLIEHATLPAFAVEIDGLVSVDGDDLGGFELRGVDLRADRLRLWNDDLDLRAEIDLVGP